MSYYKKNVLFCLFAFLFCLVFWDRPRHFRNGLTSCLVFCIAYRKVLAWCIAWLNSLGCGDCMLPSTPAGRRCVELLGRAQGAGSSRCSINTRIIVVLFRRITTFWYLTNLMVSSNRKNLTLKRLTVDRIKFLKP